jgi:hypothetical protein
MAHGAATGAGFDGQCRMILEQPGRRRVIAGQWEAGDPTYAEARLGQRHVARDAGGIGLVICGLVTGPTGLQLNVTGNRHPALIRSRVTGLARGREVPEERLVEAMRKAEVPLTPLPLGPRVGALLVTRVALVAEIDRREEGRPVVLGDALVTPGTHREEPLVPLVRESILLGRR